LFTDYCVVDFCKDVDIATLRLLWTLFAKIQELLLSPLPSADRPVTVSVN